MYAKMSNRFPDQLGSIKSGTSSAGLKINWRTGIKRTKEIRLKITNRRFDTITKIALPLYVNVYL